MSGAFFTWLRSVDSAVADELSRHGIPTQSNRLDKLLRKCCDSTVREVVKRWHRRYRAHAKARCAIRINNAVPMSQAEIDAIEAFDSQRFTRSGTMTFELNFSPPYASPVAYQLQGDGRAPLALFSFGLSLMDDPLFSVNEWPCMSETLLLRVPLERHKELRWDRVIRRWESKHKLCPMCEGRGFIYEHHDVYAVEQLGCGYCEGTGRA